MGSVRPDGVTRRTRRHDGRDENNAKNDVVIVAAVVNVCQPSARYFWAII